MAEMDGFFSAHNLDEEESVIIPNAKKKKETSAQPGAEQKEAGKALFHSDGLDGSAVRVHLPQKSTPAEEELQEPDCSGSLEESQKRKWSDILTGAIPAPTVKGVTVDNPKERVIIRFAAPGKNIANDIDVPLDITANDLIVGLNAAYHLGLDISDARQCYLSCENPIALLRGNKTLGEFGLRDGSLIAYYR